MSRGISLWAANIDLGSIPRVYSIDKSPARRSYWNDAGRAVVGAKTSSHSVSSSIGTSMRQRQHHGITGIGLLARGSYALQRHDVERRQADEMTIVRRSSRIILYGHASTAPRWKRTPAFACACVPVMRSDLSMRGSAAGLDGRGRPVREDHQS
jgi:hypothetical protein